MFAYKTLFWLVITNIISTILHYADNVLHFEHYLEPDWLNAHVVDLFWFFMTPCAFVALHFYKRQNLPKA
nr:hypothetical protein [uncultured Moraxella sp.]